MPTAISSLRSIAKLALSSAQLALFSSSNGVLGGAPESCPNPQLSCHNTTAVANTCCFNAPGGQLLQTQFWDTSPSTGPTDHWTVHGLWPDHCDGTFDSFCDPNRQYTNITQILTSYGATDLLSYMSTYWKDSAGDDETFWEHEWGKHGTCISTLDTDCYTDYTPQEEVVDFFNATVNLFKTLDSYSFLAAAGILPSSTATYTSAQIQAALAKPRGYSVTIRCSSGALDEIWYFYDVLGSVQTGVFEGTDPVGSTSNCPATGVKYLPKSSGAAVPTTLSSATRAPTGTTTTTAPSPTTSNSAPFAGQGYLNVVTGGSQEGCLISSGSWYTSGTCATYTATASGDGFTLSSSKGSCAIVSSVFTCGSSVSTAEVFTSIDGNLASSDSSAFYATAVASGSAQEAVYTTEEATGLSISWQSV